MGKCYNNNKNLYVYRTNEVHVPTIGSWPSGCLYLFFFLADCWPLRLSMHLPG